MSRTTLALRVGGVSARGRPVPVTLVIRRHVGVTGGREGGEKLRVRNYWISIDHWVFRSRFCMGVQFLSLPLAQITSFRQTRPPGAIVATFETGDCESGRSSSALTTLLVTAGRLDRLVVDGRC